MGKRKHKSKCNVNIFLGPMEEMSEMCPIAPVEEDNCDFDDGDPGAGVSQWRYRRPPWWRRRYRYRRPWWWYRY